MSVQTLYTAATGMNALETKLDVIANNMANVNTTAFKKDRANFEDLFYRQIRLPGALDADGNITSTGVEVGLGARVSSTQTNYEQGAFQTTNNPLDFALEGRGFFRVTDPNNGGPKLGGSFCRVCGKCPEYLPPSSGGGRCRRDSCGDPESYHIDVPPGRRNTTRED